MILTRLLIFIKYIFQLFVNFVIAGPDPVVVLVALAPVNGHVPDIDALGPGVIDVVLGHARDLEDAHDPEIVVEGQGLADEAHPEVDIVHAPESGVQSRNDRDRDLKIGKNDLLPGKI